MHFKTKSEAYRIKISEETWIFKLQGESFFKILFINGTALPNQKKSISCIVVRALVSYVPIHIDGKRSNIRNPRRFALGGF